MADPFSGYPKSGPLGGLNKSSGDEAKCPYKAPIELPKWPAEEMNRVNQQLYSDTQDDDSSWCGIAVVIVVAVGIAAVLLVSHFL